MPHQGDALRNLLLARYFDQYPWSKKEAAELRAKQPTNAGPGGELGKGEEKLFSNFSVRDCLLK